MRMFRMAYIMVLLGAILFSMLYTSTLASVLLAAVIALPVLSGIVGFISAFTVDTKPCTLKLITEKEQGFCYVIQIENTSFFPVSPVRLTGSFPDDKKKSIEQKQLIITLSPFKKMKINFNGVLRYRGMYSATIDVIESFDLLRIFKFKRKLAAKCEIQVLPRRIDIYRSGESTESSDSDRTLPRKGLDKTDFSSVREYKEGDLMQSVHWKLSAKQNELMVKQFEQNAVNTAVIISDYSSGYIGEDKQLADDSVIEATLALCGYLAKNERRVSVISNYFKDRNDTAAIDNMNDTESLFSKLSVVTIAEQPHLFKDMLSESMNGQSGDTTVYIITAELTEAKLSDIKQHVLPVAKSAAVIVTELEKTDESVLNEAVKVCSFVDTLSAYNLPSDMKTIFID